MYCWKWYRSGVSAYPSRMGPSSSLWSPPSFLSASKSCRTGVCVCVWVWVWCESREAFCYFISAQSVHVLARVHRQVMLLMLPMMIRVMNRHSQGRGHRVMMSSWLRGKGAGGQRDLSPPSQTQKRQKRWKKNKGSSVFASSKERISWEWGAIEIKNVFLTYLSVSDISQKIQSKHRNSWQ